MPNTQSNRKKMKVFATRQLRNNLVKKNTATMLKNARKVLSEKAEPTVAADAVLKATSALDRAAQKGIIHKNNAARKKSRLHQQLKKMDS